MGFEQVELLLRNESSARPTSILGIDKHAFCACRAVADKLLLESNPRITCEGSEHAPIPARTSHIGNARI